VESAAGAIERLVQQFAQPLAFLRELVQNSLDAGTTTVEIETGFDEPSNCCFLTVRDNGSGMTERIIDEQLTRLFSSTKENDLTKIGKFGIGFVSIFAVKTDLIVLETGCDGESWRVLFKPDRTFEKRRLRDRVEGTAITLYLSRPKADLEGLTEDARETIFFWCKFSETEILFNGEPLNKPFGFWDVSYQYRFQDGSTEAALHPTAQFEGFHGYYNRGLTLLEGHGSPLPHLAFRVRSSYLEHTLTRDNILKDSHYERILQRLQQAAVEEMPKDIFEKLARNPSTESLWEHASNLLRLPGSHQVVENIKAFPGVDEMISLRELPDTVFFSAQKDSFFQAVAQLNLPLLHLEHSKSVECLERTARTVVDIGKRFYHYQRLRPDRKDDTLLSELTTASPRMSYFPVQFLAPPNRGDRLAFYLDPNVSARDRQKEEQEPGDQIALVKEHPLYQNTLRLDDLERKLGIFLLIRKVNLDLGLSTRSEGPLLENMWDQLRWRASGP